MPKYTSKTNPDLVISVGDDDPLPGGPDAWTLDGATPKRRKRADTGAVPVQHGN